MKEQEIGKVLLRPSTDHGIDLHGRQILKGAVTNELRDRVRFQLGIVVEEKVDLDPLNRRTEASFGPIHDLGGDELALHPLLKLIGIKGTPGKQVQVDRFAMSVTKS
jgi:hypothetical protein